MARTKRTRNATPPPLAPRQRPSDPEVSYTRDDHEREDVFGSDLESSVGGGGDSNEKNDDTTEEAVTVDLGDPEDKSEEDTTAGNLNERVKSLVEPRAVKPVAKMHPRKKPAGTAGLSVTTKAAWRVPGKAAISTKQTTKLTLQNPDPQ